MLDAIKTIKGTALPLTGDDIDTDRIIPARFLRCVTFDGLGENVFYDERFADGKLTDHPMNNPRYKGAKIMVSGANFGCGSSREHAPQAIKRAGYEAVIAESFAEIFYGNASVLGLVCVCLTKNELNEIIFEIEKNPTTMLELDIEEKKLKIGDKKYNATIKDNLRSSLLSGTYDTLGELIKNKTTIAKFDASMPPHF